MSFLHDIWNPWHGCIKCSEGCQNCYMYFLDRMRDQNGAEIYKTKSGFSYPLQKDRAGHYKIQSGEQIRVCMTSDFFLEEADPWRAEAWDIMRQRSDVVFFLLTKRPQRVRECLPPDWGSGWDNIFFNVTCENQRRADERIPILFDLVDDWGYPIPQEDLYTPHFRVNCETCGSKLICNGCSDCGKCL